ncbi:hypothetical protein BDZ91DRAFT_759445 [Kalaharituber pfeilii]|nr:hypothetical protein BDZ91DRAFT_759445 [Kalaharituber pfeilii]
MAAEMVAEMAVETSAKTTVKAMVKNSCRDYGKNRAVGEIAAKNDGRSICRNDGQNSCRATVKIGAEQLLRVAHISAIINLTFSSPALLKAEIAPWSRSPSESMRCLYYSIQIVTMIMALSRRPNGRSGGPGYLVAEAVAAVDGVSEVHCWITGLFGLGQILKCQLTASDKHVTQI